MNAKPWILVGSFAAALMMSGCDMYHESFMTEKKVQISEDRVLADMPVENVTDVYIQKTADHYTRTGEGPLMITITYDSQSQTNTAMNASDTLSGIVQKFKSQGVSNIEADILPVYNQGDISQAMISYASYTAKAPDCALMSGMEDHDVRPDPDYQMGCTTEAIYAKQIADPKDLLGRDAEETMDGRRAANMVEGYRTGKPNESLQGESSTD